MKKYLILLALSGFIICLDQATKIYIHTQFQLGETVPVIQNFFNITYVQNIGAAFGILRDAPDAFRNLFFLAIPPLASIFIFFMLRSTPNNDIATILSLSSIFGGAIGNYIDRLRYGFVVDFLDFHYFQKVSWPAFNVADIAIVTGISVMVLLEFLKMRDEKQKKLA